MIQAPRASGFTLPFLLGTLVGILSGTVIGMVVSRRAISLAQRFIEKASGADEGEGPRLDLLLQ